MCPMATRSKKWGKRKGDEREGDDAEASQNKAPKTDAADAQDADTITACEISKNRKVSVRKWKGQILVDIREYWYKGTQCLPGKKGISLTLDQWNVLQEHVKEIDSAIKDVT